MMFGAKLDFQHGRKLTPAEFNHFIDRPEYVEMMRHRLIVSCEEFAPYESEVVGVIEDWLYRNSTDLYFVKLEFGRSDEEKRIEIYMLEKNDAFALKMALHGNPVDSSGW